MKMDMQLKEEVSAELQWDPAVNPAAVGVEVQDGIVTLSGHLNSYSEKIAAEKAARRVAGVRAVVVELDVKLPFSAQQTDAEIAKAAEQALQWSANIPAEAVKIQIEHGWITLTGEVEWAFQAKAAERAVSHLKGVVGVTNEIRVKPRVMPDSVKESIESALKRRTEREVQRINVEIEGSKAILRGKVYTWAEWKAARGAALSAPGVTEVIDKLTINPNE